MFYMRCRLDSSLLHLGLRRVLDDPALFSERVLGRPLRPYQAEVASAVLDSVRHRRGRTFTVLMARQCLDPDPVVASRDRAALDAVEMLARDAFPGLAPRRRQRGRAVELYLVEPGAFRDRPLRACLRACDLDHGFPRRVFALPAPLAEAFAAAVC